MFKSPEVTVIADIERLIMFLGTDELFKGGTRPGKRTAVSGGSKGRKRGGHRQGLLQNSWASFKINRRGLLLRNHLRKPGCQACSASECEPHPAVQNACSRGCCLPQEGHHRARKAAEAEF